ncbi:MAG: CHAT domain-containing protein, partial [Myxococcales bacterium]|nr:CHAT domain-containing protein [Myxococcales bacterium]
AWDERVRAYRRARAHLDRLRQDDWRLSSAELARAQARRRVETLRAQELRNEALGLLSEAQAAPVRCADLRPPEPGELLLLYHPVVEGWVGFAATTSEVTVARVAESNQALERAIAARDSSADARRLLAPFRDALDATERVRVLPLGLLLDVPFHAIPWPEDQEDALLLDHAPVAYAVDLPRPSALEPPGASEGDADARQRHAVVIGDPRSNLEHILREISEVDSILDDRRWSVELLHDADVDGDTLRAAIARATHLHYAGHGLSDGLAGAGSFVELADSQLSVGDILVLPQVPRSVVLAGCETGLTNSHTLGGGMSVARAFLAAGSESVIAADHEIDDEVAATISVELYTALAEGDPFDGPAILRRAQRAMRLTPDSNPGWSDVRAWTP